MEQAITAAISVDKKRIQRFRIRFLLLLFGIPCFVDFFLAYSIKESGCKQSFFMHV